MITFLKILKKLVQIILNSLFFVQIALMILVFLTAAYWFFDLIGSSLFSFAEPIANAISDFVKLFYNQDVLVSGMYIDGSLLLFDFIALFTVFIITKSKYYIYKLVDYIDYGIEILKKKEEAEFNKTLKAETDAKIKKMNSVAMVIELELKDMLIDKRYGSDVVVRDIVPKLEYAYKLLYSAMKNLNGCTFAQKEGKLLIFLDDFMRVDNLVYFVEQSVARLRQTLEKDKWKLFAYMAIDSYEKNANFKEDVYPAMDRMLKLRHKDQVTCFGNFNVRYNLKPEPMYYTTLLKGSYAINGGTDIYVLIKKN